MTSVAPSRLFVMYELSPLKKAIALTIGFLTSGSPSFAGGFDRFDQDVSLLLDKAKILFDISGSYVTTDRHYIAVDGKPESVPILEDYPTGSLKFKRSMTESIDCLLTGGRPFGSNVNYGMEWSRADRVVTQRFHVNELAATCSLKAPLGEGSIRGIAGASYDELEFKQIARLGKAAAPIATSSLEFGDRTWSWRAGLGYEAPQSGLVASVMYFAPIDFEFDGAIQSLPLAPGVIVPIVPISGQAIIPQGVELSARTFVAPSWMVGAGMKWVDWSALQHVAINSSTAGVAPLGTQLLDVKTFFRDGLSAAVFLGHQIDARWSILLRGAWDRAVETGWTSHSETWSLQTTIFHKVDEHTELRTGLNVAWLEAGEIDRGAIRAIWGNDVAIIPQIGITMKY